MIINLTGTYKLTLLMDSLIESGVPPEQLKIKATDAGCRVTVPAMYEQTVQTVSATHNPNELSAAERMQQIKNTMVNAKETVKETEYDRAQYIESVRVAVRVAMKALTTNITTSGNAPTSTQLNTVYDDLLDVVNDPAVASPIRNYFVNLFQAEYYIKNGSLSDDLSNILSGGLLGTTDEQKRRMIDAIKEMVSKKSTEMGIAN